MFPLSRVLALVCGPDGKVPSELRGLFAWLAAHLSKLGDEAGARRLIEADAATVLAYGITDDPYCTKGMQTAIKVHNLIFKKLGAKDENIHHNTVHYPQRIVIIKCSNASYLNSRGGTWLARILHYGYSRNTALQSLFYSSIRHIFQIGSLHTGNGTGNIYLFLRTISDYNNLIQVSLACNHCYVQVCSVANFYFLWLVTYK